MINDMFAIGYQNKVISAMRFAIEAHNDTNHRYDNKKYPYSVHLAHTVDVAHRFKDLVGLSPEEITIVICACWLHDSLEDARVTYNDILEITSRDVADVVVAVSNYNRGKNRKERMPDFVYEDIRNTHLATYVKLSDRIANLEYSTFTESHMFQTYQKENLHFRNQLYNERYKVMFDYVDLLLNPSIISKNLN